MFTLLSALFISIFNLGKVYSESYDRYITYYVEPGDTLWEIAEENNVNGKDLRTLVHEIREINNIDPNLFVGQEIVIPV